MSRASRVLVVDDEAIIADTLAHVLIFHGFEAISVHSGEAALELARTFQPDAAIIDVILSNLNGIETAIAILRDLPSCRIVLFSGHQETATLLAEAAVNGHSFDVLAKPVHPLDFIKVLGPAPQGDASSERVRRSFRT